eukprot:scaffold264_cov317-Pinguiococcus_pyrenoidosus.AAC.3
MLCSERAGSNRTVGCLVLAGKFPGLSGPCSGFGICWALDSEKPVQVPVAHKVWARPSPVSLGAKRLAHLSTVEAFSLAARHALVRRYRSRRAGSNGENLRAPIGCRRPGAPANRGLLDSRLPFVAAALLSPLLLGCGAATERPIRRALDAWQDGECDAERRERRAEAALQLPPHAEGRDQLPGRAEQPVCGRAQVSGGAHARARPLWRPARDRGAAAGGTGAPRAPRNAAWSRLSPNFLPQYSTVDWLVSGDWLVFGHPENDYDVLEEIGRGCYATVFRVRERNSGRYFAGKRVELADSDMFLLRNEVLAYLTLEESGRAIRLRRLFVDHER